jgi:hypothetical protein
MRRATWKKIETQFEKYPDMRAYGAPLELIEEAEHVLGCDFDKQYREFLLRYGSGRVGPDPIYGVLPARDLRKEWSVVEMTRHFREQGWPGVDEWYVISMDGRGNPIGMDARGRVRISDHDVGDMAVIARSFERFLLQRLKLAELE